PCHLPQVIKEAWVKGVNPKGNSTNPATGTSAAVSSLQAPSAEQGGAWLHAALLPSPPQTPGPVQPRSLSSGLRGRLPPSQLLQVLGLALFLVVETLVILIFPPLVFSHVEGWSFSGGFYFAFITLSTIGFRDYVVARLCREEAPGRRRGSTAAGGIQLTPRTF
uniref:Potassium channel domain-containing protein n=1 Tax=Propithecus coquereli TaxID=379532 RepID=A0A2K6GK94_PROCO